MKLWPLACLNGALAVGIGAFGAHGLRDRIAESSLATYQTGTVYHLAHGVAAVLALVWMDRAATAGWAQRASVAFLLGCLLFSGSLYGLAIGGPRWLGAVAPLGGTAFIVGWIMLAISGVQGKENAA